MTMLPTKTLPAARTNPDGSLKLTPPGQEPTGMPTFRQAVAQIEAMKHATFQVTSEDPKTHAMRQTIRDAAPNAEAFPCNTENRHRLAEAVAAYGNYVRDHIDHRPVETMLVNGQPASATGYLDRDVDKITMDADIAGVVRRTNNGYFEVPAADAIGPASRIAMPGGRFVCGNPSRPREQ
ncbi:MAG TPA: hypothetical protein VGG57_17880 [Stellaceae bacterium]